MDKAIKIEGLNQPDVLTIIWRYYFNQFNDASIASKMANDYIAQQFPEVPQPWF